MSEPLPLSIPVPEPAPALPAVPTTRHRHHALFGALLLLGGAAAGTGATLALAPSPSAPPTEKAAEAEEKDGDTVTLAREKQSAAGVEVAAVAARPLAASVWRTGRVALNEDRVAHVFPPADGIVRAVPVKLGQTVAAGEPLVVIDCRELGFLKLELVKARAALATERESAARVRTTMTNAAELLKLLDAETPLVTVEKRMADRPIGDWRAQLLGAYTRRAQLRAQLASLRASAGAVAETNLQKAEADADAAASTYTALAEELRYQIGYQVRQAALKQKEAEAAADAIRGKLLTFGLTAAQVETADPVKEGADASLLVVKAPFAGTVVEKHVVLSERVGPTAQLFVFADLSTVWVQADVFETDLALSLARGGAGRSVAFRSHAAGVAERSAAVVYTGDVIDKSSRALTLTAEAPNPDRALKPGMFVEVGFDSGDSTPVVQVPVTAVLRHENKPFVFVATNGDTFARRAVALGRSGGDSVEVTGGLKPGESVVVRGGFVLKSELLKDQTQGE